VRGSAVSRLPDRLRTTGLGQFVARIATAGGADPNPRNAVGFGIVGLIGFFVDLGLFQLILTSGGSLAAAHISGFLLASVLNFTLNRLFVFPSGQKRRYARFLGIGLLALALRGGAIAFTVHVLRLPAQLGLIAGVGTAAIVNYLGSVFFVFSTEHARAPELRWRVWSVAAIAYAFALRVVYMGVVELLPEEAYYWNYARHLDSTHFDHPPMIGWLIGLGTTIFGDTEFGVRIGPVLLGILTLRWLVLLARNLYDNHAAFGTVLLAGTLPLLFGTGMFATPDAPLLAFYAGALFYLERALFGDRPRAWIGVGICFGLGLLSKHTMGLLAPAVVLFMLVDRDARSHWRRPGPYLAIVCAAILFTPALDWNAPNDWASFTFELPSQLHASGGFALPLLALYVLILLTPPGLALAGRVLFTRPSDRRLRFLATCTIVPLAVFALYGAIRRPTSITWTEPIWLAVVPAMAAHLWIYWERRRIAARVWKATAVGMLMVLGGLLHYVTLGLPGLPPPTPTKHPAGWKATAQQVDRLAAEFDAETGERCFVIDARGYRLSSELEFYSADDYRLHTSAAFVEGDGLIGAVWQDPQMFDGRTALLVSFDRPSLDREPDFPFAEVGPIEEQPIEIRGRVAAVLLYRVVWGYRPPRVTPKPSNAGTTPGGR